MSIEFTQTRHLLQYVFHKHYCSKIRYVHKISFRVSCCHTFYMLISTILWQHCDSTSILTFKYHSVHMILTCLYINKITIFFWKIWIICLFLQFQERGWIGSSHVSFFGEIWNGETLKTCCQLFFSFFTLHA